MLDGGGTRDRKRIAWGKPTIAYHVMLLRYSLKLGRLEYQVLDFSPTFQDEEVCEKKGWPQVLENKALSLGMYAG